MNKKSTELRAKIAVAAGVFAFMLSAVVLGFWLRDSGEFTARELTIVKDFARAWPAVIVAARAVSVIFLPPLVVIYLLAILTFSLKRAKNLAAVVREAIAIAAPLVFALSVKIIVARPRPDLAGRILPGLSFPSGHVACAAVVALALLWLGDLYFREKRNFGANVLRALILAIPLFVAISRVVVGEHYPSDVAASLVATPAIYFATKFLLREKSE